MFDDTLTITADATDVILNRIKEPGADMKSEYYLNDTANDRRFTLAIQHTVPKSGIGESHMVRLDVSHYSTEGLLLRMSSAWTVIKTTTGLQDDDASEEASEYLSSLVSDQTFIGSVVDRVS